MNALDPLSCSTSAASDSPSPPESVGTSTIARTSWPARSSRLLLFDVAGVDAWPLMGVADLAAYNHQILRGEPTVAIRVTDVSARIPLPLPAQAATIFEMQLNAREKAFAEAPAAPA